MNTNAVRGRWEMGDGRWEMGDGRRRGVRGEGEGEGEGEGAYRIRNVKGEGGGGRDELLTWRQKGTDDTNYILIEMCRSAKTR
jgi:hypothetical protein